jgi:hypothetical protein
MHQRHGRGENALALQIPWRHHNSRIIGKRKITKKFIPIRGGVAA